VDLGSTPKPNFADPKVSALILNYLYSHVTPAITDTEEQNDLEIPAEHDDNEHALNVAPLVPLTILNVIPKFAYVNVPRDSTMVLVLLQHFSYPFPGVKIRFLQEGTSLITESMGQIITCNNIICSIPPLDVGR
jgi:hypothetical protein